MQLSLSVKDKSIETSGITKDYKEALCEFIWNSFEANATEVIISYTKNELSGINSICIGSLWDLDDNYNDAIYDHPYPNAVIGGYPVFTQEDPRSADSLGDCDTLLFELDSVEDRKKGIYIMWGDSGTGTFMIPLENLRKLDFSRVAYNYDCY